MQYVRVWTAEEAEMLSAKADQTETTVDEMLNTVVDRYLKDVSRDMGVDLDTQIAKAAAEADDTQKQAALAALKA